jgi:predicted negative regulator of RcsB-dependent stress response
VDIQTRPAGRTGALPQAGTPGSFWLQQNLALVIRLSVILAIVILAAVSWAIWSNHRNDEASAAFSQAMDIYDSPLKQPGEPNMPDITTYADAAARAKAVNPIFLGIADKYSWTKAGANARYFAGLTDEDMGDTAAAEKNLKMAADKHDANLAALAKMSLASLYLTTGRRDQSAKLYRDLIAHPTTTVSADAARLALAASEETTNPQDARLLYAKIKDTAKDTVAGEIATQKLSGK